MMQCLCLVLYARGMAVIVGVSTLCPQKNIPDIFDCNLKTNYQILIIFDTNVPDTTCHQMTIYVVGQKNLDLFER